ncbi:Sensor kinase protein RcsC [Raoultella terrigena]|uniref:Sensor kinase protein RcsC n=1 Tax=Raoultella terrigena TaxID=577 RepID=A0A3P8LZG1_RAOTE|nr:Sensor kinase protein RcsC [Raoultella terrigena]
MSCCRCWDVSCTLTWPAPNTAPALSAPETQTANHDDMMILVVDDHPINRRLLADQLGSLGYQCVTANDGV